MTEVVIADVVVDGLQRARISAQEIVELMATVAAYNCVSRFMVALDVGEKNFALR